MSLLWSGGDRDGTVDLLLSRVMHADEHGWSSLGQPTGGDFVVYVNADRLTVRVQVSAVTNVLLEERLTVAGQNPAPSAPDLEPLPEFALNVDVDLADAHLTDSIDVKPHLNRSVDYLQDVLIPFIGQLLEEGS